jgi:hypothetical protein
VDPDALVHICCDGCGRVDVRDAFKLPPGWTLLRRQPVSPAQRYRVMPEPDRHYCSEACAVKDGGDLPVYEPAAGEEIRE